MASSEVNMRSARMRIQVREPQDGRKYSAKGDPWFEWEVEIQADLDRLVRRMGAAAVRNQNGRAVMADGAITCKRIARLREVPDVS